MQVKILRATYIISLLVMASFILTPLTAISGTFPAKPITMIVPYGAGGGTDTMARILAKALRKELGQPVVVTNRKGGGGAVGVSYLKNAPADGYTFLMGGDDIPTWTALTQNVDFKFEDFKYIAALSEYQNAFVVKSDAPYNTLDEFVSYAKKHPGMSFATTSPIDRMLIETIKAEENLDLRIIKVAGGAEMVQMVLGDKIDMGYSGGIHGRYEGKVKVVASCNKARLATHPDIPSISEKYGIAMPSYVIFMAPAGVPDDVAKTLENALLKASQDSDFQTIVRDRLKRPIIRVNAAELNDYMTKLYKQLKEMVK